MPPIHWNRELRSRPISHTHVQHRPDNPTPGAFLTGAAAVRGEDLSPPVVTFCTPVITSRTPIGPTFTTPKMLHLVAGEKWKTRPGRCLARSRKYTPATDQLCLTAVGAKMRPLPAVIFLGGNGNVHVVLQSTLMQGSSAINVP